MTKLTYRDCLKEVPLYKAGKSSIDGVAEPIKISSNENAYGTSPKAIEAYHECVKDIFKYPNGDSINLKQALAKRYSVHENQIICGAGSDNIIELCCLCFVGEGDEGIFSTHTFPVYDIAIRLSGGIPVTIPYKKDMTHDIDGIINACNEKTKIIFIANPDNPTGLHVSEAELKRLINNVPKHVLIVIDEAYYEFATAEDFPSSLKLVEENENVVVTRTFSKMFGLASLRVGWGYLPPIAYDALARARSPFNVNIPAQFAAAAALEDLDWQKENLRKNISVRKELEAFFKEHNFAYLPSQANFVLVKFSDAVSADEYLQKNGIIVRHVRSNGLPDYLRFSLGTPEQNKILCDVLSKMPQDIR